MAAAGLTLALTPTLTGRMHQWRQPGSGGGTEELHANWRATKWARREWMPLVSFRLEMDETPAAARRAAADTCASRELSWAGSHVKGISYVPPADAAGAAGAAAGRRRRGGGREAVGSRLRARLLREVSGGRPPSALPLFHGWKTALCPPSVP